MYPRPVGPGFVALLCRSPLALLVVTVGLMVSICWMGSEVPPYCQPKSLLAFAFDDGYESAYSIGFPILDRYGYVATLYVITDMIGKPGRISMAQLQTLYRKGWEIASHTVTHPHLIELTPKQIEYELRVSREYLERQGFEVSSFAVPFGEYDEQILAYVRKFYASNRTIKAGLNEYPLSEKDRYELKAIELNIDTSVEEVKAWLNRAIEENKLIILVLHQLDGEGYWNYRSQDLEEIARYANDLGFEPFGI